MQQVEIQSAWLSKINWAQAVGVVASVGVVFGVNLDAHTQVELVGAIQGVVAVATWVFRTFFNKTITPSVAKNI